MKGEPVNNTGLRAVITALLCIFRLASAAQSEDVRTYNLPLLVVGADNVGSLHRVEFTFRRKHGVNTPLSIAIAEDTPGGTGESLRASVWLAAMVAAMDRLDDLSGVKIELEIPGQTDGPSAGGVICLGILSALDGREFPGDCVMTGSILPDGTIGAVGGIAAKMRAAAAAGAKRVLVPDYLRFEDDPNTGQQVDLKRLAQSLQLEFVPVRNITQAYQATHNLPAVVRAEPDESSLNLPDAMEDYLKQAYDEDTTAGTKCWDAIPKELQEQIAQEPWSKGILIDEREKAEAAFRSGKLLYAANCAGAWRLCLESRKKNEAIFAALSGKDFKENLDQLDAKLQELTRAIPDPASLIEASRQQKLPYAGIQLCADYYESLGLIGDVVQFQAALDGDVAEMKKPENQDESRQKELVEAAMVERGRQLLIANVALDGSNRAVEDSALLAATFPNSKITGDVVTIERLFYSAYKAAFNSFKTDVVKAAASELQVSEEQTLNAMSDHDNAVTTFIPIAGEVEALHHNFITAGNPDNVRFTGEAGAYVHAANLARVTSLIARWGDQLQMSIDDKGAFHYGRTDLLNYLLSTARENALRSIAECRLHGILCVEAISAFEDADFRRDDSDNDKVNVLRDYWNSSLQAKAMLMLFARGK